MVSNNVVKISNKADHAICTHIYEYMMVILTARSVLVKCFCGMPSPSYLNARP
jgi:hypothetical protein